MKTVRDPDRVLADGLTAIRAEFQLPVGFPADAMAEAEAAAAKTPSDHVDRTAFPFVSLDPASSQDLDQAFAIEAAGNDWLLHYAIADVGWFVADGGALDREAWARGTTQYLPDGKVPLYPPILSEEAASLLPGGPRPAVVFAVRIAPDGSVKLDGVERALIESRAKLAYETARDEDLPAGFAEIATRIEAAERSRGASRIDPPEREVVQRNGHFALELRPQTPAEQGNAALSLATNLAVADAMLAARTGLFRTMAEPQPWAERRLRHTAKALGVDWLKGETLDQIERALDPANRKEAALMLAIRRASPGADYSAFEDGETPWHAAVAATYAHATAPLRRLADRYVVMTALAIANGRPVPGEASAAFPRLPKVMARADNLGGQIERAVIDLAETVVLQGREGETFAAAVTDIDQRGTRIQLCDLPVVTRIKVDGMEAGTALSVRLDRADPATRSLAFSLVAARQ
jgi:exoribonuclease R